MTMRQLRQRIARDLKDAQKGPREIPSCPDGAARALAGAHPKCPGYRRSDFGSVPTCKYCGGVPEMQCRYCLGPLLADGEGGWTCPQRDSHEK